MSVIDLAQDSFRNGTAPDKSRLLKINKLIRDINNDAMLLVLRQSGQAHSFGSLRHFLTVLKFTADRPTAELTWPASFNDDLTQASETIRNACNTLTTHSAAAPSDGDLGGSAGLGQTGQWKQLHRLVADISGEIEKHRRELRRLGVVILGLVLAVFLAMVVHFALMILQIIYRGRSICDVPMTLEIFGEHIEGRITIIGKLGCFIIPIAPPDNSLPPMISRGTYINITIEDQTLNAKTVIESKEMYRVLFSTPLTGKNLRRILVASEVPVRYDLSALTWQKIFRRYFGIGTLPKI
ncbi:MAG: hypothetical protein WA782_18825 [Sulfitobacter sp.]